MKTMFAVMAILISMLLGCGGGGSADDGDLTFSARGEANRIAAAYRAQRDLATLLVPYVHDGAALVARHGQTVTCLLGGTVVYSYNPGPGGGVEQRFDATFTNCQESIGVITGVLTVMWNSSQDNPSAGTFTPLFFGTLSVDGVQYNYIRPSTVTTNYNSVSGVQQSQLNVFSLSGVQPPVGPGAKMQNLSFMVQTQPGLSTVSFSNVFDTIVANTGDRGAGAAASLRATGSCTINRITASAAILGISTPQTCNWDYSRANRSGMLETVGGPAVVSSGLLNVVMSGAQSKRSDSAQFDWPTIMSTYNFDMDGR